MFEITRGYKQGRAVMFYDLLNQMENKKILKVSKDDVVKLAEANKVLNTKIQWWEGKAIVRCTSNFPIVKLGEDGAELGEATKSVRSNSNREEINKAKEAEQEAKQVKAVNARVVGKIDAKKAAKRTNQLEGYTKADIEEARKLRSTISYDKMKTVNDLFTAMAKDFNVKGVEKYRTAVSKKVNMTKAISSIAYEELQVIQKLFSNYLMNMAYAEIEQSILKYKSVMS